MAIAQASQEKASPGYFVGQAELLEEVSRTFALTIPQLSPRLRYAVGNGYLLCRIADTIEDDPRLDPEAKFSLFRQFSEVLLGQADEYAFRERLRRSLSEHTPSGERNLIDKIPYVVDTTRSLPRRQRDALIRCARVMCNGMYEFQMQKGLDGLDTVSDMDRYCYVVAGVVGEMLTELFCDHSEAIREQRETMMELARCFGQGLQMTNILKDVWEDREAGHCWLPRSVFLRHGEDLGDVIRNRQPQRLAAGIEELVGIAHAHLVRALTYSCLIPKTDADIRRFCLWAVGLALLTLQKIYRNPGYDNGRQVKISRRQVSATIISCNSVVYSNRLTRLWFELGSFGLPVADPTGHCHSQSQWTGDAPASGPSRERRGNSVH